MIHTAFHRGALLTAALLPLLLAACGEPLSDAPASVDADAENKAALKKEESLLSKAIVGVWHRDAEDFRDRLTTYTVESAQDYLKMSEKDQNDLITRSHEMADRQKAEVEFLDNGRFEMRVYDLPPYEKNLKTNRGTWHFEGTKLVTTTTSKNGKLVAPEPLGLHWDRALLVMPKIEPFPWVFRRD